MTGSCAVFCITRNGAGIARKIESSFPGTSVFCPEKFRMEGRSNWDFYAVSLRGVIAKEFHRYDFIVFIFSIGAVIRMIAPHLKDKHTDPGVVVVDDSAAYVVSLLSGHVGGANQFTQSLAKVLHATPVITTASDVGGTISVDILGREFNWKIEDNENVTAVSAAVVNREPVALVQETGEKNWWRGDIPLPGNIWVYPDLESIRNMKNCRGILLVTDRILSRTEMNLISSRLVLYRPRSLVCGIGCNRGTSADEIFAAMSEVFEKSQLSIKSLRLLASIDQKSDEEGILEIAKRLEVPIRYFTSEELKTLKGILNPSDVVRRFMGTPGVSEPAALLAAKTSVLLVEKQKFKNTTFAIARTVYV